MLASRDRGLDAVPSRSSAGKRASRLALLVVVAIAALVGASAAYAWENWIYYHADLNPGGYFTTPNENYRYYNQACRDGNSGQMSVQYRKNGSIVANSGSQWTNCQQGALVQLGTDGTFQSRCTHTGTVSFLAYCQTTRPT